MEIVDVFINCNDEFRMNLSKNTMTYKKFNPIYLYGDEEFKRIYKSFLTTINFRLWVHLEYLDDVENSFGVSVASSIKEEYPEIKLQFITRKKVGQDIAGFKVFYMYQVDGSTWAQYDFSKIPYNKSISNDELSNIVAPALASEQSILDSDFDFAIITALYDYEFEEVEKLINWEKPYRTETKEYRIGYMKSAPSKKVVAAVPSKTGMVDSAIIATQMLELFKPKYLLMSGVCGGKKTLKFGDIVLASSVFTFQKGKISDILDEEGKPIKTYDCNQNEIDLNHIYDIEKNQLNVQIYNFEREQESIEIDSLLQDDLQKELKSIKNRINEPYKLENQKIDIHFEPMACSYLVVNKDGYYEENIKPVDRKTVAVEMESFGVARACKFANDGKTKFVIFKSVMDKMSGKTDKEKEFAAYTSAQFLKHLILDNVLK